MLLRISCSNSYSPRSAKRFDSFCKFFSIKLGETYLKSSINLSAVIYNWVMSSLKFSKEKLQILRSIILALNRGLVIILINNFSRFNSKTYTELVKI